MYLMLLFSYLLLILRVSASNQPPAAPVENDYDIIAHFQLQRLLVSSDFLKQLECIWKHIPDLRRQTYNEDYDQTIWELKEITENIPFQAFLSRLNILQSVKAASVSQTAVHGFLVNEYAALSMVGFFRIHSLIIVLIAFCKIKARLTGKLEKARSMYDLRMYQLDTLHKELDHINIVRNHIENLDQTRRSRLSSIVDLESKIRSSERLISRQKELLSSYGEAVSLSVRRSPNFQPFRSWGSIKSSSDSDEEIVSNISHEDLVPQKDGRKTETVSESDDDDVSKCSSEGAKITSRGSRCTSISCELTKIYSFDSDKGIKKRKWWKLGFNKK